MPVPHRSPRNLKWIALIAVLLAMLAPECTHKDRCQGPGDTIDETSDRPAGELPSWALGGFGRHDIDIFNYKISQDGTAYSAVDGGDYGGCGSLTAVFANGRVHLVADPQELTPAHTIIVRTTDGRFFEGDSDNDDLACGWYELEPVNLCGKKGGGCGGYAGSEPCPWQVVSERMGCDEPAGE